MNNIPYSNQEIQEIKSRQRQHVTSSFLHTESENQPLSLIYEQSREKQNITKTTVFLGSFWRIALL